MFAYYPPGSVIATKFIARQRKTPLDTDSQVSSSNTLDFIGQPVCHSRNTRGVPNMAFSASPIFTLASQLSPSIFHQVHLQSTHCVRAAVRSSLSTPSRVMRCRYEITLLSPFLFFSQGPAPLLYPLETCSSQRNHQGRCWRSDVYGGLSDQR